MLRSKVRLENRAKEDIRVSLSPPPEQFRVDKREVLIKQKDIRFDWTAFFDSLCRSSINESDLSPSSSDEEFVELDRDCS